MQYIAISMIRTEKAMMTDKTVLNLIPCMVFPNIKSFMNCIKDDIFSPFPENVATYYPKKNKIQEYDYIVITVKIITLNAAKTESF